jgi:hypothetical protein
MHIKGKIKIGGSLLLMLVTSAVLILDSSHASATVPYIAAMANLTNSGSQTSGLQGRASISQDGRYVVFGSVDSGIVANDTNGRMDVFVRDLKLGTTTRVNLSSTGAELSLGYSGFFRMSANGRFVLFDSANNNVVSGDTNSKIDIFLRDLKNNTTEMVSLTSSGGLPNDASSGADISADGRYVAFKSYASNIVSGDTNGSWDIFIRDRKLATTKLISKSTAGLPSNGSSNSPSISCDGSYVTFSSNGTDLVSGDTNGLADIFLMDRVNGDSVSNITPNSNGTGASTNADISCNGETILFHSDASNLVINDTNNAPDLFAYNMIDGTFERVNLDPSGNETVGSPISAGVERPGNDSMDFSGRYVVFSGYTSTLVSGDTNNTRDVFIRDLKDGVTQIISKRNSTTQTNDMSFDSAISLDGRKVLFTSFDNSIVSGDTNGVPDLFVSDTGI